MGKRKTDIDNVQKLRRWQITINNPIDKGLDARIFEECTSRNECCLLVYG